MEPGIFTAFYRWIEDNSERVNENGVILSLEEPKTTRGIQSITLELENRRFLGRCQLHETGHLELRCIKRQDHKITAHKTEVYSGGQISEELAKILSWMDPDAFPLGLTQRFHRGSGCGNRIGYATRSEARQAKKQSKIDLQMNDLHEEECNTCGMWHLIGNQHSRTPIRKRSRR